MTISPHTNNIVSFCRVIFVNVEYNFVERHESNLCAIEHSMETTFVQILQLNATTLAMVHEHSVVQSAKCYVHYSSHKYHWHVSSNYIC
jgi:hypothetical protein